jgi:Zn-dependent protease with chaperone function
MYTSPINEKKISNINDCVSDKERSQRAGVFIMNIFAWIFAILVSYGSLIIIFPLSLIFQSILAEYHIRKLEAIGATVSSDQFPEIDQALNDVCQQFGILNKPRVIVLSSGESNAFAVLFAKKQCILILSELLEGIIDNPAELRFLLAHEVCHTVLDQGFRGHFEIYKPAAYRQARELTCDNAGMAASADLSSAQVVLRKLCVGRKLYSKLQDNVLIADAERIYSGFTGWIVKQYLTHPPVGTRLQNVASFYQTM